MSTVPLSILRYKYEAALAEYFRNLKPEEIMEATTQATQRKITLASLELVHAQRPEVQFFNELVIQYPVEGTNTPRHVTPDNMIVVHDEPIDAEGSFALLFQPVGPFLAMEYVSKSNKRKDYEDNFQIYEQLIKIPYYMIFNPDAQEVLLFCLRNDRYVAIPPNEQGRCAIPEIDLELAILDGWVRYWYRDELLPLPGDLLAELRETQQRLREQTARADDAARRADDAARRADEEHQARVAAERELENMREELERLRRDEE